MTSEFYIRRLKGPSIAPLSSLILNFGPNSPNNTFSISACSSRCVGVSSDGVMGGKRTFGGDIMVLFYIQ